MKIQSKALRAVLLFGALAPFALAAFQEPPSKPAEAAPTSAPQQAAAPAAAVAPEAPLRVVDDPTPTPTARGSRHRHHDGDDDNRVTVNDETIVAANETVVGNAVAISGPLLVDGNVDGNAVSVMGRTTINGTVHGNAVAVLGTLQLGPNARVDGNAVCVGGRIIRDPSAVVGGNSVPINFGADLSDNGPASSYWRHGLVLGRPLAFGPHLHAFWLATACLVALYLLLALLFPNGVWKCADTLALRPGVTFLTGFLAVLGLPVLFILLCVTIVGIPVAVVVLPLAVMASVVFGKTAVYALVGRAILGRKAHAVLAVLVGVVIAAAAYLVPLLGLCLWLLIGFLGFACALTTLFSPGSPAAPVAGPAAAPGPPPPAAAAPSPAPPAAVPAPPVAVPSEAPAPPLVPPVPEAPLLAAAAPAVSAAVPVSPAPPAIAESALPRAGFWIRMLALLLDVILVGIVAHSDKTALPVMAIYAAVLWKLKGSTVGGIIFGLKVVRLDGRPMDWATAIVRSLSCFFSLLFLFIGFLWIGFDPEKQGWHDKIAGTVVVRLPRGQSLV